MFLTLAWVNSCWCSEHDWTWLKSCMLYSNVA